MNQHPPSAHAKALAHGLELHRRLDRNGFYAWLDTLSKAEVYDLCFDLAIRVKGGAHAER